ncbi:MAG: hypothetical protein IJ053_04115 [Lachnospiraceae bacterium]|nr:hypothetical protein [Lachnospiraceae bacterium]
MDKEYYKVRRRRIRVAVITAVFAVLLFYILFMYFKITTGGRTAFKEAKNVKLALNMIDIEYYSKGKSVYEPGKMHGMSQESLERIQNLLENDGVIDIISYDSKKRIVTCFTYQVGHYKVTYLYDDGDSWNVDYLVNLYDY